MSEPERTASGVGVHAAREWIASSGIGARLARGAGRALVITATGAVVSFAAQVGLARLLGQEAFGVYMLALSWMMIAQLFAKLELDTTSVRFVGAYVAERRYGLLRGYLARSRQVVLAAGGLIATVGIAGVLVMTDRLAAKHDGLPAALVVVCGLLPAFTLLTLNGSVLQGLQQYALAQLPANLVRPLTFGVLLLIAALIPGVRWTAAHGLALNLAGVLLALTVAERWRARQLPPEVRTALPEYDVPAWRRTAAPLFLISVSQGFLSSQADVLIVGTLLSVTDAAIYGAALTLIQPLTMTWSAVTFVALPMIADLYARGDRARLQSLVRAVTVAGLLVVLPMGLVLMAGGGLLLRLYGPEYVPGHGVLAVLAAAQVVVGLVGGVAGFLMTMTAHEREAAWIIGISAVAYIVLAFSLTPVYGAIGTAAATLLTAVGRAIALSVYVRRVMGIRVPAVRA